MPPSESAQALSGRALSAQALSAQAVPGRALPAQALATPADAIDDAVAVARQHSPAVRAVASGLGCALPPRAVSSAEVGRTAGVEEAWIVRRTGIRSRRRADPALSLCELASASAKAALTDAGVDAGEVELVLLATISQEQPVPNVAPQVAAAIGATGAGALDLGAACSGFVAGLAVASAFIEAGRMSRVLVIGADLMSRLVDPSDRRTAPLFGDGAGALLLSASASASANAGASAGSAGVQDFELGADGTAAKMIDTNPATGFIRMDGPETYKAAVATMERLARSLCARAGLDPASDVDLFVFHQANGRITQALAERMELAPERVVDCIAELGNTSAASVPLALAHARSQGRLRPGDRVLLSAVGAGFTSAGALLQWGED